MKILPLEKLTCNFCDLEYAGRRREGQEYVFCDRDCLYQFKTFFISTPNEKLVYELIEEFPDTTAKELQLITGIQEKALYAILKKLEKKMFIYKEGIRNATYTSVN